MIYSILFAILAYFSYRYFRYKFIPKEVRENAEDFNRNGSADDLQRGYHSRELWSRVWPALACCALPALTPALFLRLGLGSQVNGWAPTLSFLAVAVLLTGAFARFFTPLLNEARTATRPDITTWYASPASKSFPDAAVWKEARKAPAEMLPADRQDYANHLLEKLLTSTWRYCLLAAALLALGAVAVAVGKAGISPFAN